MPHLILLGDSTLDNAAYVRNGEPAVIEQLRRALPADWRATLLALDGSTTRDIPRRLEQLPADASHLLVSVGGNDALEQAGVLTQATSTIAEALLGLAVIRTQFQHSYDRMLQTLRACNLPLVLCTVYDPQEADPQLQTVEATALMLFNDHISRAAIVAGLPLIDLRLVCNAPEDYANPIEPSVIGGAKIAAAIARAVTQHDFAQKQTTVYT